MRGANARNALIALWREKKKGLEVCFLWVGFFVFFFIYSVVKAMHERIAVN